MIDFAHSTFTRIIIHRIFPKLTTEEHSSVEHEDNLIEAGEDAHTVIKTRLNQACGKRSKSFNLQIANITEGSFFQLSKDTYNLNDEEFIQRSKEIASILASSQKRSIIPGGYLMVIEGTTDDNMHFLVGIKAELQEAVVTSLNSTTNRKQIEVLKDIFLSPADKFFKIGILKQAVNPEESYPNSDFSCMIYDDQFRPGDEPAEFFYKDFLGFSTDKNEKMLSKGYYDDTKSVIINHSSTHEERSGCLAALRNLYTQDQSGIIDPINFGEQYLPPSLHEYYVANILTHPKYNRPFVKNLDIMGRELTQRVMRFKGKVTIQAPEDTFDDNISVVRTLEEAQNILDGNGTSTLIEVKGTPYIND